MDVQGSSDLMLCAGHQLPACHRTAQLPRHFARTGNWGIESTNLPHLDTGRCKAGCSASQVSFMHAGARGGGRPAGRHCGARAAAGHYEDCRVRPHQRRLAGMPSALSCQGVACHAAQMLHDAHPQMWPLAALWPCRIQTDVVQLAAKPDKSEVHGVWVLQKRVPNNAVVAESVVAIVTRPGNPKNIRGWDDLIRSLRTTQCSAHCGMLTKTFRACKQAAAARFSVLLCLHKPKMRSSF